MKLIICPLGIALQILLFISSPSKAQEKKNPNPTPNQKLDSIVVLKDSLKNINYWKKEHKAGLILTQTSFVNWSAGGDNTVAGLMTFLVNYNYEKDRLFWKNRLNARYGLNKKDNQELRKTDDMLEIISDFGYRKTEKSKWYYSARFNFRTQFANGYKYPNTASPISSFFAPAYLFVGIGSEYTDKKNKLRLYGSPLTNKTTLVLNQRLANQGAFGVPKAVYDENGVLIQKGVKSRTEIGILLTGEFQKEVMKNILMFQKLIMYTDYINNFGNVDFDWEIRFDFLVNKYIKANLNSHFIFDDDIKQAGEAAKIQLKQLLGIGFSYSF